MRVWIISPLSDVKMLGTAEVGILPFPGPSLWGALSDTSARFLRLSPLQMFSDIQCAQITLSGTKSQRNSATQEMEVERDADSHCSMVKGDCKWNAALRIQVLMPLFHR